MHVPQRVLVSHQVAAQPCLCQEVAELGAAHTTCRGSEAYMMMGPGQRAAAAPGGCGCGGLTYAANTHVQTECGVSQALQQRLHLLCVCVCVDTGVKMQAVSCQGSMPIAPPTWGLLSCRADSTSLSTSIPVVSLPHLIERGFSAAQPQICGGFISISFWICALYDDLGSMKRAQSYSKLLASCSYLEQSCRRSPTAP